MKIYIRKDLNMRRGKACAQAAHVALNLFYSAFNFNIEKLTASISINDFSRVFGTWIEHDMPIDIIWVDSERELKSALHGAQSKSFLTESVVDLGKTEFKGRKTMTAIAVLEKEKSEVAVPFGPRTLYQSLQQVPRDHWLQSMAKSDEFVKQMIVVDAAHKVPMDDHIVAVCRAVLSTCTGWLNVAGNKQTLLFKLVNQPELVAWLLNHTTKIVVGSKSYGQYLSQLAVRYRASAGSDALQWQQRSNPAVIAFPPLKTSKIDPLTRDLKLM